MSWNFFYTNDDSCLKLSLIVCIAWLWYLEISLANKKVSGSQDFQMQQASSSRL